MLESISFIHPGRIDPGAIAEAILFYQKSNFVLFTDQVEQLITAIGADRLLRFIKADKLSVTILDDQIATLSKNKKHQFTKLTFEFSERGKVLHIDPRSVPSRIGTASRDKRVEDAVFANLGRRGPSARRTANGIIRAIKSETVPASITQAATQDIADASFASEVVADLVSKYAPSLNLVGSRFDVEVRQDQTFAVNTNIDFSRFRTPYPYDTFSLEALISQFGLARHIAHVAAASASEIHCGDVTAVVNNRILNKMASRHFSGQKHIASFQEFVLNDATAVRDAINSGRKTFVDFEELLERADYRFRPWLKDKPFDADLLKSFLEESTRAEWATSNPGTVLRWIVCTSVGLASSSVLGPIAGTLAGVAVSAADMFLTERFAKGWRPNQFVDGALAGWVRG